jgi:eukaryotic-like serine/threonine-protein kinase
VEKLRPEPPTSPERIGRYQLVTEIGSGPLGSLSAAYVTAGAEEGRIVSIRRLPIAATEREAQQRVSRAGIGAMSIRHARLAAVLDVLPGPTELAVVSEYVEATSLRSLQRRSAISRAALPPPVAVAIAADVLRALRAARDLWRELSSAARDPLAGSVHGGLLPDSVTIASFGETMLADLGVAGAAATIPGLLRHAEALPYRAPEQLAGEPPDERSDVYTVGVLLWEMLANRPLFGTAERLKRADVLSERAALEREIRKGSVQRLDQLERSGPPIQPMLVEITHEALALDRDRRFPTLDALLDALRTLSRDAIAQPEQISVAVDRLVRSELDAQRVAIEMVAGFDRVSAAPESARSTRRPPPPEQPLRFAVTEAPTARRRQTPRPNTVPAAGQKPKPPSALGRITAGTTKPAMKHQEPASPKPEPSKPPTPPPVAKPSEQPKAPEKQPEKQPGPSVRPSPARESLEPSGGLALSPPVEVAAQPPAAGPRGRGKGLLLLLVVAAAALLGVAMVRGFGGSSTPVAQTPEPSAPAGTGSPEPPPTASAEQETPPAPAEAEAVPAAPGPSASERPVQSPREVAPAAPAAGKKPFRPRGI